VELMSAIDEYLQGKYGTGESQSLGQLNDFDTAGYAGTQSVAKEFGLSDNNPLVQQWDQDQTLSTLNENPLQDLRAESVPARAAAITQSVFGSPAPPLAPASARPVDNRLAAMQARGAKAVHSQSIAAERKQMREQMLQKFEVAAEAPTKKLAAQAADTIGDGTVPSDWREGGQGDRASARHTEQVHIYTHARTRTRTHTHAHAHTRTHTHTHTGRQPPDPAARTAQDTRTLDVQTRR